MTFRAVLALIAMVIAWTVPHGARAQNDVVWVQIEARPSLSQAQARADSWASELEDVNGFALRGGWFGIVLGPYTRSDAQQVLNSYKAQRLIPQDSFIAFTRNLRQQFFPPGADVLSRGAIQTPLPQTQPAAQPDVEPQASDETPSEARRSERALNAEERRELQIALRWAGFYRSTIDGAFGRGTRNSMAAWQRANGYEVTGILTTLQRAALIKQYNAVLDGLGLEVRQDTQAGIEMLIPTNVVAFDEYEFPFARYAATGDIAAELLLISQDGTQDTLFGLYDIMQTLEIVPLDGKRERRSSSFLLIGENDKIVSHTEAELRNGQVKGFTLVWPTGDEERRTRVLEELRGSFRRIDGVLTPDLSKPDEQAIDLVAGLQVRRPLLSRSGFFVDADGTVVTTLEAVGQCTRVTLDNDTDAEIALTDDTLGIAVLRPKSAIAAPGLAQFSTRVPRLDSDVAVAGFSYEGVLGSATMTFGTLSDLRGLKGEAELTRVALEVLPGDAGGPVLDQSGGVLGMLLPRAQTGRQLPRDVNFAADGDAIQALLEQAGIPTRSQTGTGPATPEDISDEARNMTVLVSCWD